MDNIIWNESFSVGVKVIDAQHKKLFSILNRLNHALAENDKASDQDFLENVIYDLKAYVEFHFKEEEKYFDKFGYEERESHAAEHKKYIEDINRFHSSYLNQEKDLSEKMLTFIEGWILGHINSTDKKYTECFNKHGLI